MVFPCSSKNVVVVKSNLGESVFGRKCVSPSFSTRSAYPDIWFILALQ